MDDMISTRHSDLRMMQRSGNVDRSMTEVWDDSIPCLVEGHGCDEARVSPELGIVLLMEDGVIVTVLYADPEKLTIDKAYLEEYLDRSMGER